MPSLQNPELALLYAGHLKTIIFNLQKPQVSMLENADFPVKFIMMSAQYPTQFQTKLFKVVTHVFEYLNKES